MPATSAGPPAPIGTERMDATEFRAFMERHGWSGARTARELGTTAGSVSLWSNGLREIPPYIARLVRVIDRLEAIRRTATAA